MEGYLTQNPQDVGVPFSGIGAIGTGGSGAPDRLTQVLTTIIGVMTLVAGLYFIFVLISGGIEWMSSGGDKGKLAGARSKIFSAAIGLAIVVAAIFVTEIFAGLIGIEDILNPAAALIRLAP